MSTRLSKSERPPWWPWPLGLAVVTAFFVVVWLINREVVPTREPAPTVEKTNEVPAAETNEVSPVATLSTTQTPSPPTNLAVDTNVPAGYKRIQVTLVGDGFAVKPSTNAVSVP